MSRVRFMKAATGEELHLPPHISTRVRTDMPATVLEWWLRYIASLLEKPISAIRFVATTGDGNSKVISNGCSWTLLTCLQQDADGNILVQVLVDARQINMCGEPIDGGSVHDDVYCLVNELEAIDWWESIKMLHFTCSFERCS